MSRLKPMAAGAACLCATSCIHVEGHGWTPITELAGVRAAAEESAELAIEAAPTSADVLPEEGTRSVEFPVGAQAYSENAQRLFGEEAVALFAESPAPVIAPASLTEEQRDAYAKSFRVLRDGFFAVLKGDGYDTVVNGTLKYAVAPAAAGDIEPRDDMSAYVFSQSDEGANVSFRRFNTDYSLEFMCHEAAGGSAGCVDEAASVALADELVLVGGGR